MSQAEELNDDGNGRKMDKETRDIVEFDIWEIGEAIFARLHTEDMNETEIDEIWSAILAKLNTVDPLFTARFRCPFSILKRQTISFLDLPREIRDMIYDAILSTAVRGYDSCGYRYMAYVSLSTEPKDSTVASVMASTVAALANTCSAIRQEILPPFLSTNKIHVNFSTIRPIKKNRHSGDFPWPESSSAYKDMATKSSALTSSIRTCLESDEDNAAYIKDLTFNRMYTTPFSEGKHKAHIMFHAKVMPKGKVEVKPLGWPAVGTSKHYPNQVAYRLASKLEIILTDMVSENMTGGMGIRELRVIREMLAERYDDIVYTL